MIYAIATVSLMFIGYLVLDFYREQFQMRRVPVRANRNGSRVRKSPRM